MGHPRALARRASGVLALSVACLLLDLPGCGPASENVTPEPRASERIVSLAPSLSYLLIALGAKDEIVGVDQFSKEIPGLEGLPSMGGLFAADLERLLATRPTLVLAVRSEEQADYLARARARGIQVEAVRAHTLKEVLATFERVGARVGRAERGRELARTVRAALARIRASVKGRRRVRTAIVLERDPLYVVGGGSFASDLLEAAGGENVFGDLAQAYPRVSLEALAGRAPELILETSRMEPGSREEIRDHWGRFSFVERAEPVANGAIVLPRPELGRAAEALRDILYPSGASTAPKRDPGAPDA